MELPQSYTISKFLTYTEGAKQYNSYLVGGCPICHEGSSWGSKRRLYYYLEDDFLYCYNCSKSWNPYWWIKEVTGMTYHEIKDDLKESGEGDYILEYQETDESSWELPELPGECVNLKSDVQLDYYKKVKIVQIAYQYCKDRRLLTALNSPKALYVCIKDRYHENRLIIPCYQGNKIVTYTSRKLVDYDKKAKYLLKFNSQKPLFGFENIDLDFPYIFLFEGQIDSMFLKNGVALSGLELTSEQEEQLDTIPFHQRIWIFDNLEMENKEVKGKAIQKLKNNESLFLFKDEFSPFKDLNDYCVEKKQDFVDPALILANVYSGGKGLLNL
jgi:hypothetical protein